MAAQHLVGPPALDPVALVAGFGAVQAQEHPLALWSLGQRTGASRAHVQQLLDDGRILRTHALRPTWHFLTADDIRWVQGVTAPRVRAANRYYERQSGLDDETVGRVADVLVDALRGGNHLTRREVADLLEPAGLPATGVPLAYALMRAELDCLVTSGVLRGKQQTYALLDERVPGGLDLTGDDALVELVRRYLTGHGPATVVDLAWWSSLTRADVRRALDLLGGTVEAVDVAGTTCWHVPAPPPLVPPSPDAHLLQTYDEYVVAFTESRPVVNLAGADIGPSDTNQFTQPVVVDSQVVAWWRPVVVRRETTMTLHAHVPLTPPAQAAVEDAARRWAAFQGTDVTVAWV